MQEGARCQYIVFIVSTYGNWQQSVVVINLTTSGAKLAKAIDGKLVVMSRNYKTVYTHEPTEFSLSDTAFGFHIENMRVAIPTS